MTRPELPIALALIWREGRLLISRRREETHLGGFWEFPGGKIEAGESPEAAAEREAREELAVQVRAWARRAPIRYAYAERTVCLHPVDCDWIAGEPEAVQVAQWRWVAPENLAEFDFPPANRTLIADLAASGGE